MEKILTALQKVPGPLTVWSPGTEKLIKNNTLRFVITVLVPLHYGFFALFGFVASGFPIPTFAILAGTTYSLVWGLLVGTFSTASLIGLVFRFKFELYTSIILTFLLAIYSGYIVVLIFTDAEHLGASRLALFFGVVIYTFIPGWRAIDITLVMRNIRMKELYAKQALGGVYDNNSHDSTPS